MDDNSTPITADSIRYAASLDIGKDALRKVAHDAADQIERMDTNFTQVMQFAQQLQAQSQEWEQERAQNHDLIEKLQRENGELQLKIEGMAFPGEPEEELKPVLIPPAPEGYEESGEVLLSDGLPTYRPIEPDTVAEAEESD